ncbi:MAG: energy transducer TonB [Chitinophagales bacterium]
MTRQITLTCFTILISLATFAQSGLPPDSINSEKVVFERVEQEADFAGGIAAWQKYIGQKLNPNVPVDNGAPIGKYTVVVQFIVDKEGNIQDVKALTNHGFGMEQEVMRLIKSGPKWTAARQNGRSVNAYRKQPVTFMVEDEDIEITSKESYVLHTGIENAITIKVKKVKTDDLSLTITQGSIVSNGDGRYTVKVNKTGKAVIRMFNAKKGNKELGAVTFEVQ